MQVAQPRRRLSERQTSTLFILSIGGKTISNRLLPRFDIALSRSTLITAEFVTISGAPSTASGCHPYRPLR
jgi:hypothetical protein